MEDSKGKSIWGQGDDIEEHRYKTLLPPPTVQHLENHADTKSPLH